MPPDRTKHLLVLGACWALGLCAVLAGPIVGVFAIPLMLGVVLDVLDGAGAAPTLLFLGVALALLSLSRPAVRARLRRAARLPLTPRNRSAGAPAQPI
jgi:membrane protein implicated in regulation of membrane protease activity